MNDTIDSMQTPEPFPGPLPEPEPVDDTAETVPTKRGKVRWYHVAVLGVAVLACAATVGFSTSESSSRDDATAVREQAQRRLAVQRDDTDDARTDLATTRVETKASLEQVAQLTTLLHEFSDLASQEVDTVAAAHQLSVSNPDAVDEYNEQIRRSIELVDQMQTKAEAIIAAAEALQDRADAQLAVATSSR